MNAKYWNERFEKGIGNGAGSRGRLAEFKLRTVQDIVDAYKIGSVVDVGCGDGSQLRDLKVDSYIGLDISDVAVSMGGQMCYKMTEKAVDQPNQAEMSISLDVIQYLDEEALKRHLDMLLHLSSRYVLIYAPNRGSEGLRLAPHMHFREFVPVVKELFKLEPVMHVPNEYPAQQKGGAIRNDTSYCEFYLFDMEAKPKRRNKDD